VLQVYKVVVRAEASIEVDVDAILGHPSISGELQYQGKGPCKNWNKRKERGACLEKALAD